MKPYIFREIVYVIVAAGLALLTTAPNVHAEHPIDVQRLTAKGEHLKALSTYDALPDRKKTTYSTIAAARSAWALGLNKRAIEGFDRALQDEALEKVDRGRVLLSRGIIEYQEARYATAALYADRASQELLEPTILRAKVWLLWGQALQKMNAAAQAEEKLVKALEEASDEDLSEVHYTFGLVEQALGKNKEAREHFEKIPLEHEKTPLAMRNLATIALQDKRYSDALFWLEKGRKDFRDSFLDSWVDYTQLQAAIGMDDVEKVRSIREEASKQYPPSDKWFALLEAAAEGYEWKRSGEQGKKG